MIGAGSFCALQVIPEGTFVVLKAMVSNAQLNGVRGMVESVLESGRFLIGMEIGSSIAVHLDNLQPIEWPGDTWVCRGCKNKKRTGRRTQPLGGLAPKESGSALLARGSLRGLATTQTPLPRRKTTRRK